MWATKNATPYKAAGVWGRNKDGMHEWIVVVKATFDIRRNGDLKLSNEQIEPLIAPEYNALPGFSSLRYEADLVATKPTTDVLLNGTAYAPNGRASTNFNVGMSVGPVRKMLRVNGNQIWEQGVVHVGRSAIEPITQMPIIYEKAYGGYDDKEADPKHHRIDTRNPVGCGVVANPSHRIGTPLPNFEYPDGDQERTGPAGFGALDSFWSPRRELAGTYDEAWEKNRLPLLPSDWDPLSLQCSPSDQRPPNYLRGGELVELLNLTPGGELRFALPRILLVFNTLIGRRVEEYRGCLSAVIIEPDYPRVIMVWQSSLLCPTDIDYLEDTIVREKAYIT